jgi:hypothetical protein
VPASAARGNLPGAHYALWAGESLMPRTCSCCSHPDREGIDAAIVAGEPFRAIAIRVDVSKDAIARHARSHVSRALRTIQARREERGAETLVERVERLYARAAAILDAAEADGRASIALGAVRELRGVVELLARLTGELDERQQVVNIIGSPDWQRVRDVLIGALAAFPEARRTVAGALVQLESG